MSAPFFARKKGVAPLVGAWIEIAVTPESVIGLTVAPLVGAWIEISNHNLLGQRLNRRTPCGCVD